MKMFKLSLVALVAVLAVSESNAMFTHLFRQTARNSPLHTSTARYPQNSARRSYSEIKDVTVTPLPDEKDAQGMKSLISLPNDQGAELVTPELLGGFIRFFLKNLGLHPDICIKKGDYVFRPSPEKTKIINSISATERHFADVKTFSDIDQGYKKAVAEVLVSKYDNEEAHVILHGVSMKIGPDKVEKPKISSVTIQFNKIS
jgi:hypothetical protein